MLMFPAVQGTEPCQYRPVCTLAQHGKLPMHDARCETLASQRAPYNSVQSIVEAVILSTLPFLSMKNSPDSEALGAAADCC